MEYRTKFRKDVIIDFICFRKYGHNELDDPAFTQPVMYNVINNRTSIPDGYEAQLKVSDIVLHWCLFCHSHFRDIYTNAVTILPSCKYSYV